MNKLIHAVMAAGVLGGVGSLVHPHDAHAQASSTVGSLRGGIRDSATKDIAVGATVVATSPALQGEQVVITDENGLYFINSLPPGLYTLTVYYQDNTFSRGNVLIQVGKEAVVNVTVDTAQTTGKPKGETIVIQGTTPIIDQGSTKTGVTLTDDYTRNIPTGRTFGGVLGAAATSQDDFFGTSIAGSTSNENTYIVEGINTTDTSVGNISSNLPTEFVQETEIITGGYNAEYGRATGGIVNVVTKQGSNEFHGSVFGYLTPGSFSAAAKTIQHEGGSIDTQTNLDYSYDIGAEVGGPIIKDKLWFHIGFNPSETRQVTTRLIQQQVDKNGDGIPDIDSSTGFTVHEPVSHTDIPESRRTYFFTAKISGEINPNNQYQISAFGNPRNGDRSGSSNFDFALGDTLLKQDDGAYDLAGKYTSKLNDGATQIDAVLGYHRGFSKQTALNTLGNQPLTVYNYERSLYDFSDVEGASNVAACQDGSAADKYTKIRNCPVSEYAEAGLGQLEDRINARESAVVSITQRVKLLGYHTFKAGIDFEAATYNTKLGDTGGIVLERNCNRDPVTQACSDDANALPGSWSTSSFDSIVRNLTPAEVADPSTVMLGAGQAICSGGLALCGAIQTRKVDTSDRSLAAYIQDSWQIRPNFAINAGFRFEQQALNYAKQLQGTVSPTGEITPTTAFTLNNPAPRIGFIWDPTEEGKSKIFAHYGRFYENVPLDLDVRSLGGEIDNIGTLNAHHRLPGSAGYDPNCNVDHAPGVNAAQVIQMCSDFRQTGLFGGGDVISPTLSGQYTNEFIVGAEYELVPDLKLAVNYTHRTLPVVIEDGSADGGNTYILANPGQDNSAGAADLRSQAAAVMGTNPGLAQVLLDRATSIDFLGKLDPPSRTYDAVTLRAEGKLGHNALLIASYTYSSERGNYPGLFSVETNQIDPNISSQYDLPDLLSNRYGSLGLDRPHNLKVDGFYMFDLKKLGLLTIGTSMRAQSGIAHNALGAHPTYGLGESYLLPRGSFARSPVTEEVDIHVAYGRIIKKKTKLEGFIDVFNLFNQQDELSVDENYTFSNALPIVGGDAADLAHLKIVDENGLQHGSTVVPNKNFDKLNVRSSPLSIRLGFRLTF